MPSYFIHRLKESQRAQFRFAPHVSGLTQARLKDYQPYGVVEASHPYAAWSALRGTESALTVGDILETETRDLFILKYVGFEEARWVLPEVSPAAPLAVSAEQAVNISPGA